MTTTKDILNNLFPPILNQKIYRTEFEEIIKPLVEKTLASCTKALKMASISVEDIDEVVMVGGSTQIPLVRHKVKDYFTALF